MKLISKSTFKEIDRAIDECLESGEISSQQALAAQLTFNTLEEMHDTARQAAFDLVDMAVGQPERPRRQAVARRQPTVRIRSRQEVIALMMLRWLDGQDIFTGEDL